MGAEICVFQNCTPGVGNYALRPPHYFGPVEAWTIRVNMRTHGEAPSVKSGATVTRLYDDIDIYNTTGVTNMEKLFYRQQYMTHIAAMDTSLVTNMTFMLYECYALQELPMLDMRNVDGLGSFMYGCRNVQELPFLDLSNVRYMGLAFHGCSALTTLPAFNLSSSLGFQDMFSACTHLTSIPEFTLPSTLQNCVCTAMFEGCSAVEGGALALYNRLSALRPKYYGRTFRYCGSDTTTGAAELAQIPSSWK